MWPSDGGYYEESKYIKDHTLLLAAQHTFDMNIHFQSTGEEDGLGDTGGQCNKLCENLGICFCKTECFLLAV